MFCPWSFAGIRFQTTRFHVLFVLRGLSRSKFKLMELLHVPSSQPYFWQRGFVNEASWMFFFPEGGFARVNPFRFRCRTVQRTCFGTHFVFQLSFFFGKGDYAMYKTESSEYTRYAIKQWSVKGGRLLVLITPIHGMTGSLGLSYHTLL